MFSQFSFLLGCACAAVFSIPLAAIFIKSLSSLGGFLIFVSWIKPHWVSYKLLVLSLLNFELSKSGWLGLVEPLAHILPVIGNADVIYTTTLSSFFSPWVFSSMRLANVSDHFNDLYLVLFVFQLFNNCSHAPSGAFLVPFYGVFKPVCLMHMLCLILVAWKRGCKTLVTCLVWESNKCYNYLY